MRNGAQDQYTRLSKEIKRQCRRDKERYILDICKEIESHGNRNESRDLYTKVKLLAREFKPKNWAIQNELGETINEQILEV